MVFYVCICLYMVDVCIYMGLFIYAVRYFNIYVIIYTNIYNIYKKKRDL